MITNCAIVAIAVLLAVNVEGSCRTGVGTNVSSPAHRTVTLPSHGVTVTLSGKIILSVLRGVLPEP